MRVIIISLFAALTGALGGTVAHAEPIPVTRVLAFTAGGVTFNPSDVLVMSFGGSGPGFSLGVFAEVGSGSPVALTEPTMNPSFQISRPLHVGAVLQADGHTIPLHGGSPTVSMQITGPTVPVVRRPSEFGGFSISVAFPFTLTGSLLAASLDDGTEYRLELRAQGRGVHSFFEEPDGFTFFAGSSLTFESEAPIPEPGTMLLVSTGIALGAGLRRRRLRSTKTPYESE